MQLRDSESLTPFISAHLRNIYIHTTSVPKLNLHCTALPRITLRGFNKPESTFFLPSRENQPNGTHMGRSAVPTSQRLRSATTKIPICTCEALGVAWFPIPDEAFAICYIPYSMLVHCCTGGKRLVDASCKTKHASCLLTASRASITSVIKPINIRASN